ncbi:ATP-binding protein [Streptomyces sp. NPDC058457]|uniref:ATP-binding protein n=1 Tax=Streptomyces sp. NPDC058457 TaxID=3346507 RepID=UPI0036514142
MTAGFDIALPAVPVSVERARQVARAWCRQCRVPNELVDTLLLLVSELCTNAVLHGTSETVGVRVWMPSGFVLRIEVADHTPSPAPSVQQPDAGAENGRGLFLVDALVADAGGRWGFTADGTRAWCTLGLPTEVPCPEPAALEPDRAPSLRDPVKPYTHF